MTVQSIVMALVVAGSFIYAAWALMPQALRRGLFAAVRKTPLRAWLGTRLTPGAQIAAGACGSCDNCAASASKPTALRTTTKEAPLRFVRMARRR